MIDQNGGADGPRRELSPDLRLQSQLFFRLLPYQILLIVINAVNGIVDGLYASNAIGKTAMSAIGLYGPLNHFLYAASIMLVSGSQMLFGRYLAKDRGRIQSVFTVDLVVSAGLSVVTALLLVLGVATQATRVLVSEEADLFMLNRYILGQAPGIPALRPVRGSVNRQFTPPPAFCGITASWGGFPAGSSARKRKEERRTGYGKKQGHSGKAGFL